MWKVLVVIFLALLVNKEGYSTTAVVSKSGSQKYFCNENQSILIDTRTNVHKYIKLKINYTRLDATVYKAGFYNVHLTNVLLFSNADVEITFQGVENLKREDGEPGEIIVDYTWEGFIYKGDELIDGEHPLNFVYTYLFAGGGAHTIKIDGQEVEGAYLLPLKLRARISTAHLINKWFSDPDGFIMTIIAQ